MLKAKFVGRAGDGMLDAAVSGCAIGAEGILVRRAGGHKVGAARMARAGMASPVLRVQYVIYLALDSTHLDLDLDPLAHHQW